MDVNVLLALLDVDHVQHAAARAWLLENEAAGWASCALTENGFVRIISQSGYTNPVPIRVAIERLVSAKATDHHRFWESGISLADKSLVDPKQVLAPSQVTDLYLLALAVRHGGRFATFDRQVPLGAVVGATPEHLVVL
ncbi:TA system VapC family ribonuclease toxin [Nocardioides sp.]|uniref:TA system VapC family ribonuclease toxin n=1 Tax=Nocardioides sp. TaxID=35761 RepID=UPI0039E55149